MAIHTVRVEEWRLRLLDAAIERISLVVLQGKEIIYNAGVQERQVVHLGCHGSVTGKGIGFGGDCFPRRSFILSFFVGFFVIVTS